MSGETNMEAALVALLQTVCPRVYPDAAPSLSASWVTYQHIGGAPLRYIEGGAADIRHSMIEVSVWAESKANAITIIRQIEDAICGDAEITGRPLAEPSSLLSEDQQYRGMSQDFDIWFAR